MCKLLKEYDLRLALNLEKKNTVGKYNLTV